MPWLIILIISLIPSSLSAFDFSLPKKRIIGVGTGNASGQYSDNDFKVPLSGTSFTIVNYSKIKSSGLTLTTGFSSTRVSGSENTSLANTEFNYELNGFFLGYGYGFGFGFLSIDPSLSIGIGQSTYQYQVTNPSQGSNTSPKRQSTVVSFNFSSPVNVEYWDNLILTIAPFSGTSYDRFQAGTGGTAKLSIDSSIYLILGGYL